MKAWNCFFRSSLHPHHCLPLCFNDRQGLAIAEVIISIVTYVMSVWLKFRLLIDGSHVNVSTWPIFPAHRQPTSAPCYSVERKWQRKLVSTAAWRFADCFSKSKNSSQNLKPFRFLCFFKDFLMKILPGLLGFSDLLCYLLLYTHSSTEDLRCLCVYDIAHACHSGLASTVVNFEMAVGNGLSVVLIPTAKCCCRLA